MSAPSHDDDQLKLEIFDSFSKTVMRNASRNFAAAAKTRKKNESVNTDIVQYILKTHGENAVYPSEHFIDAGNGYCCVVATEWLYQAMLLLPPKQKTSYKKSIPQKQNSRIDLQYKCNTKKE